MCSSACTVLCVSNLYIVSTFTWYICNSIDAMETVLSISTTAFFFFLNHPCGQSSWEKKTHARPSWKRGIRALLADDQLDASSCSTRLSKETATALPVTECKKSRRNLRKGVEARKVNNSTDASAQRYVMVP